ncbi:MAG: hypothetical protein GY868_21070 [Deltaproteobacteria bacterium]|nr:hypothetical protein [Deltaproteobacteria bacterium]
MKTKNVFLILAAVITISALIFIPSAAIAKRGMPDYVVETNCGDNNTEGSMVLIAIGTNYGRTFKVAEKVAEVLCRDGYRVDIRFAQDVAAADLTYYDAVIAGSCIYIEKWHPDVLGFIEQHQSTLAEKAVAYYCVNGLMGLDYPGAEDIVDEHYIQPMYEQFPEISPLAVGAFAGAVNYRILLPLDWLKLRLFMPGGDWTDWDSVEAWAEELSTQLE